MLVSYSSPPARGTTTTAALSKSELSSLIAATTSDSFWQDLENLDRCLVLFKSTVGQSRFLLTFDLGVSSPTAPVMIPQFSRNEFAVHKLLVVDKMGDKLLLPSVSENIVLDVEDQSPVVGFSALASGLNITFNLSGTDDISTDLFYNLNYGFTSLPTSVSEAQSSLTLYSGNLVAGAPEVLYDTIPWFFPQGSTQIFALVVDDGDGNYGFATASVVIPDTEPPEMFHITLQQREYSVHGDDDIQVTIYKGQDIVSASLTYNLYRHAPGAPFVDTLQKAESGQLVYTSVASGSVGETIYFIDHIVSPVYFSQYQYALVVVDESGNKAFYADSIYYSDYTPPVVGPIQVSHSAGSLTVSASISDNSALDQAFFYADVSPFGSSSSILEQKSVVGSNSVSFSYDTSYDNAHGTPVESLWYTIVARDIANNLSMPQSIQYSFQDTSAPVINSFSAELNELAPIYVSVSATDQGTWDYLGNSGFLFLSVYSVSGLVSTVAAAEAGTMLVQTDVYLTSPGVFSGTLIDTGLIPQLGQVYYLAGVLSDRFGNNSVASVSGMIPDIAAPTVSLFAASEDATVSQIELIIYAASDEYAFAAGQSITAKFYSVPSLGLTAAQLESGGAGISLLHTAVLSDYFGNGSVDYFYQTGISIIGFSGPGVELFSLVLSDLAGNKSVFHTSYATQ